MTTLQQYAEINPPAPAIARRLEGDVAFVPMAAVTEDGRCVAGDVRPVSEVARGYTYFERGDILMAKITPCMENGKAALLDDLATPIGFGSTEFHVLRPREGVHGRFLFHLIWNEHFRAECAKHMTGSAGQKRVPAQFLRNATVPLVAPSQQRRIAEILDRADAIRRKRQQALALTDDLLRSTFLDMFGDPVTNPRGWPISTFGEELASLEYGPRFHNESYAKDGVRIVRITDLDTTGRLNYSSMPRLVVSASARSRYSLKPDDVIFARSGATVGKTALYCSGDPEAIPGAYFIRLRFKPHLRPLFARHVLASERIQQIIVARSRQSAQQNFSGPGIRELPIPIPPLPLQLRLDDVAANIRIALEKQRMAERTCDQLFSSLIHSAFRSM